MFIINIIRVHILCIWNQSPRPRLPLEAPSSQFTILITIYSGLNVKVPSNKFASLARGYRCLKLYEFKLKWRNSEYSLYLDWARGNSIPSACSGARRVILDG